jgi:hypothetical protein
MKVRCQERDDKTLSKLVMGKFTDSKEQALAEDDSRTAKMISIPRRAWYRRGQSALEVIEVYVTTGGALKSTLIWMVEVECHLLR